MQTRRVQQNNLVIFPGQNPQNSVPGSLGFGTDYGDLLTEKMIKQGRFAGIWRTDDCDDSGTESVILYTVEGQAFSGHKYQSKVINDKVSITC